MTIVQVDISINAIIMIMAVIVAKLLVGVSADAELT